jgi:hypothetical protein
MRGIEAGPEPEPDERRKKVDRSGMLSSGMGWVLSIASAEIRKGEKGRRGEGEKGRRGEGEAKDSYRSLGNGCPGGVCGVRWS